MIARHAAANGVPTSLVRRVIHRESRGNPRAVSRGNYGLMQIRLGTARAMGYRGSAAGLLNPETNMTYAVKYLAGAYHAAGGNEARAQSYYQTGYYGRGRGSAVASRRHAAPTYAQANFRQLAVRESCAGAAGRHAHAVAQATPTMFNWQVAQTAAPTQGNATSVTLRSGRRPSSTGKWRRRPRRIGIATCVMPLDRRRRRSTGTWRRRRHRGTGIITCAMRPAKRRRCSTGTWRRPDAVAPASQPALCDRTGADAVQLARRVGDAAYSHRHHRTRHSARSTPNLLQSLKKLFTPPRSYRVAWLNRGATR